MLCACTVDAVLGEQEFARFPAFLRIPPAQCAGRLSSVAGRPLARGAAFVAVALPLRGLEVPDPRCGSGGGCRRQCGRENEPGRESAQHRSRRRSPRCNRRGGRAPSQGTLVHALHVRRPHARRCGPQQGRTCLPNDLVDLIVPLPARSQMRFTEERSLSPTREPPTRSASATRGPPAVFDVADVVGPPGPIYDSGTPHALGDRILFWRQEDHTVR